MNDASKLTVLRIIVREGKVGCGYAEEANPSPQAQTSSAALACRNHNPVSTHTHALSSSPSGANTGEGLTVMNQNMLPYPE